MQKDQVEKVDFFDHFSKLNNQLLDRQKLEWRSYYMLWLRSALYYDGKQILIPRGNGFGYDIRQVVGLDQPLWVYNKLRPYSDEVTSMWVQSAPEVLFAVLDEDERKATKAINQIQTLNKYFNRLHFTEKNLQIIAKFGQFCGNYSFEHWYDKDASNGFEWYEEYSPLVLPAQMNYECLDCQTYGEMPENGVCQQCGSQSITPVPMQGVNIADAVKSGEGWKKTGEIVCRPFPAWSQRYSLTTGASESPWRYAEEDLPKEQIEAMYGKLDGTALDDRWSNVESMHPERVMRRAVRQRGGYESSPDDADNVLAQRFWYQPEMLALKACRTAVTLPDGTVIPAGQRLSDVFPNGMCILTAPGLPHFLNVYPENHTERFTDGQYGLTPGIKVGQGIEDGVEAQRQMNVLKSGVFRYLQKTLQPSIAVNGRVFQDSKLFNRLDNVISINNATLPERTSVGDHFAHVVPPPINGQVFGYTQELNAEIQAALKAYNSEGDAPGVTNNTATAAKIGVAKAASAHNIYLALYAQTIKEVAVKRLLLAQKHYQNLRLVHDVDALSGEARAMQISNVAIQSNFMAWVKTGSFMPNMDMEKRAKFMEGATAATTLAPLGLLNPASLKQINEVFGADFTFEHQNEKDEECEEIIEMTLKAAEQMQSQMQEMMSQPPPPTQNELRLGYDPNKGARQAQEQQKAQIMQMQAMAPQMLYELQPVNPYTLGHDIKINYYRDWMGSPEGRRAPEIVIQAIILRVQAHFQAQMQEQMLLAQAAAAPQQAMQQEQQQADDQRDGQKAEQEHQRGMERDAAKGKTQKEIALARAGKGGKKPAKSDNDTVAIDNPMAANPQSAIQPQNPMIGGF